MAEAGCPADADVRRHRRGRGSRTGRTARGAGAVAAGRGAAEPRSLADAHRKARAIDRHRRDASFRRKLSVLGGELVIEDAEPPLPAGIDPDVAIEDDL